MNICDIACNFTSDRFASDLDEVINRALKKNVKNFVLLCSELEEVNKILEIKDSYPCNIFYTYGTHPHNANTFNSKSVPLLNNLISIRKPNAVGEIGLDYFRNHSSQEEQIFAFEEQIKIALDNELPIYLHQRDAHDDFINLLQKYKNDIKKGVVHCFTGTKNQLDEYLNMGLYIGLTGWICDERRNKELRESVKSIPIDRLMIETDSPYLIPRNLPSRPKNNRNEPMYITHIADEIAKLMNVDKNILIEKTYNNSIRFFT